MLKLVAKERKITWNSFPLANKPEMGDLQYAIRITYISQKNNKLVNEGAEHQPGRTYTLHIMSATIGQHNCNQL